MDAKRFKTVLSVLAEKVEQLQTENSWLRYQNEQLKERQGAGSCGGDTSK